MASPTLSQYRTTFPELAAVADHDAQRALTRAAGTYSASAWGSRYSDVVLAAAAEATAPLVGADVRPYRASLEALSRNRQGRLVAEGPDSAVAVALTFSDFGTQDPLRGFYTDWRDFMDALAAIPIGMAPTITLAPFLGAITVPLAGMPPMGWDFRGGSLVAFYESTGTVVLDCPEGVKLDNLFRIGKGMELRVAPAAGTGVLEWSAMPLGAGRIFRDAGYVRNNGAGALIRSPGAEPGGTTMVYAGEACQYAVANPPLPAGAKLVFLSNDGGHENDGLVLVQQSTLGGLPTDAFANNTSGCNVVRIWDAGAHPDTLDLATWQPNLTATPVFDFPVHRSKGLAFDAYGPDWSGTPPADVQSALTRMAAAVVGLLGVPVP